MPAGWSRPDADEALRVEAELARELPRGHVLDGVRVSALALRDGIDDVAFLHLDGSDRLTVVHLSWSGRVEIDARHPTVEFEGSFERFLAEQRRILEAVRRRARERDTAALRDDTR